MGNRAFPDFKAMARGAKREKNRATQNAGRKQGKKTATFIYRNGFKT